MILTRSLYQNMVVAFPYFGHDEELGLLQAVSMAGDRLGRFERSYFNKVRSFCKCLPRTSLQFTSEVPLTPAQQIMPRVSSALEARRNRLEEAAPGRMERLRVKFEDWMDSMGPDERKKLSGHLYRARKRRDGDVWTQDGVADPKTRSTYRRLLLVIVTLLVGVGFIATEMDLILLVLNHTTCRETLLCCILSVPSYADILFKKLKWLPIPAEKMFLILQRAKISLHQYHELRLGLIEAGISCLPCRDAVSKFQSKYFAGQCEAKGVKSHASRPLVYLDIQRLYTNMKQWMADRYANIDMKDVDVALRIDGRPFRGSFDVLVGLSFIHKGIELSFGSEITMVPILIYKGHETLDELYSNVAAVLEADLDRLFKGECRSLVFTCDAKLFWAAADVKTYSCPLCPCEDSKARAACTHRHQIDVQMSDSAVFKSWLCNFVPCILHARIRIATHFMQVQSHGTYPFCAANTDMK